VLLGELEHLKIETIYIVHIGHDFNFIFQFIL
jgi:hypothetical protein